MKKTVIFTALVGFLALFAGLASAVDFKITAVVPTPSAVNISAASVPLAGGSASPVVGTNLTFGTMTFDATNNVWAAPNYFAIDVANAGAGSPTVLVTYGSETKPTNQTIGLGNRATVDFKRVVYVDATHNTEFAITGHAKKALINVNENVSSLQTQGGWLRMYVGVATDSSVANASPFTNADQGGSYGGTLTVTATPS